MLSFSLKGFLVVLVLILPSIAFNYYKPQTRPNITKSKVFFYLELIGRIGCILFMMIEIWIFKIEFKNDVLFIIWQVLIILILALYYTLWLRYYLNGMKFKNLFDKVLFPIPMSILPVSLFILTAAFTLNPILGTFAVIFGIGHIVESYNKYMFIIKNKVDY